MQIPASIEFEGKTLKLWRIDQLENSTLDNLRLRSLDMRDVMGQDKVPPLPRSRDGIIKWILDVQAALTQPAPEDFGVPQQSAANYQEAPPTPYSQRPRQGVANYQEAPPTPVSQRSPQFNRGNAPDSIEFEGKTVTLWRFDQLSNISDERLRTRARDLRDTVGVDRVPVMPRHREDLVAWIMNAQSLLSQNSTEGFGMPQQSAANYQEAPLMSASLRPHQGVANYQEALPIPSSQRPRQGVVDYQEALPTPSSQRPRQGVAIYQEAPPTPSSQRSTPFNRSNVPDSIEFEGKTVPLWRFEQISNISDERLRTRARDLRDTLGVDRVPVMPRHHEDLVAWIMDAQSLLSNLSPEAFGRPQGAGYVQGWQSSQKFSAPPSGRDVQGQRGFPSSQRFAAPPSGRTESDQAYLDARAIREQARLRNAGVGNSPW